MVHTTPKEIYKYECVHVVFKRVSMCRDIHDDEKLAESL